MSCPHTCPQDTTQDSVLPPLWLKMKCARFKKIAQKEFAQKKFAQEKFAQKTNNDPKRLKIKKKFATN